MDYEQLEEQFVLDMKDAIKEAQAKKWLGRERYGYCFSCSTEKLVFDVIAIGSPVQPPKCVDCLIDRAASFLESPEADQIITEFRKNGPKESE